MLLLCLAGCLFFIKFIVYWTGLDWTGLGWIGRGEAMGYGGYGIWDMGGTSVSLDAQCDANANARMDGWTALNLV